MPNVFKYPTTFKITALFWGILILIGGCAVQQPLLNLEGLQGPTAKDTIWDTDLDQAVTFEQLMTRIQHAQVLYIGERHTDSAHHQVQLKIIRALVEQGRAVQVGMEMFDHTYQAKLDRWTAGDYDWPTFLNQVHWYANWKFDDDLYAEILKFIQAEKLKLVGLNIPFCLPPKIATGGLDSLSAEERAHLPARIDTSVPEHRSYVKEIFDMHHLKGRDNFEFFYEAQCAWEDGMAQAIADHLPPKDRIDDGIMVVLAGNGHIQRKFGIPDRAYARTKAPFKTIYLASPGDTVQRRTADFIWATGSPPKRSPHRSFH